MASAAAPICIDERSETGCQELDRFAANNGLSLEQKMQLRMRCFEHDTKLGDSPGKLCVIADSRPAVEVDALAGER